jgi:CMP-N,N'-diacetyllegionaminic acid synthase
LKNKIKILAIIPARKGSKGLKNKNILKINKKTLVEHAINSAKRSKYINHIAISTDSNKIKNIAKKNNVWCEKLRPKIYSRDKSSIYSAIKFTLENINIKPDIIVELHPTYIFRKTSTIDRAINLLIKKKKFDSLISIKAIENTCHPNFAIDLNQNKKIKYIISPDKFNRHSLNKKFFSLGYILISRVKSFYKNKSMIGPQCLGYVIKDKKECLDINDKAEFMFCNLVAKNKNILK